MNANNEETQTTSTVQEKHLQRLIALALKHEKKPMIEQGYSIPGLQISTRVCSNPLFHIQESAACFILQGRKQVTVGTDQYSYDPATFLIASVDLPMTSQITNVSPDAPYLGLSLTLDPQELATLLVNTKVPTNNLGTKESALKPTPMTPLLCEALVRLLRLYDAPDEIPVLAPIIKREIHFRLLQTEQYPALYQLTVGDGKIRRISQAIDWMKDHLTEPLKIEALAKRVAMSPSSLHHQFKDVTSISPLQFQKQLRLQKARRLIMIGDTTVEGIAREVGYESSSQFSREYSRLFECSPSEDMRRFQTTLA